MNANDVIEAYVTDVARRLPRKQRNDVAFELRALVREELQDRSDSTGRPIDADMALQFLRNFGRPEDVAMRYRPAANIIDPVDAPLFLRATVIGLAIIWSLGLLENFGRPIDGIGDFAGSVGRWLVGTFVASMWWPGVLVVGFGLNAWSRRRGPQRDWSPTTDESMHVNRGALLLAIIGILVGVAALWDPRVLLDLVFQNRAAYSAYEALTYTPSFRDGAATWIFGTLLLYVPLLGAVIMHGRWTPLLRKLEDAWGVLLCALMTWALVAGPIFSSPDSNGMFKLALLLSIAGTLVVWLNRYRRRVVPAPGVTTH